MDKDINEAIKLLKDDNLVWSNDFETIRRNLARLMEKIFQIEYHWLEPEIGDLALNLIKEREINVGESNTAETANALWRQGLDEQVGQERPRTSCCCTCQRRVD